MAIGDEVGRDTAADLNQYVHSWLDDAERRVTALLMVIKGHRLRVRFVKWGLTVEVEEKEKS
jgi:hypothetical protein